MRVTTHAWRTQHVATRLYRVDTTTSTQHEARRLIEAGDADGALIVAATQTSGRGRFARAWHSPRGNLYVSIVIRPTLPPSESQQYNMLTALAMSDVIRAASQLAAQLKWPNDVLIHERKVAGILSEIVDDYLLIGIGVNVNATLPESLPHATSLRAEAGHLISLDELLKVFVERVDKYYAQLLDGVRFTQAWSERLVTLGKSVRVQMGDDVIEGIVENVDESGALLVRRGDGALVVCRAGEVTLTRA